MQAAENVIAGQFAAYNARDIETFMSFWHADAEMFGFPDAVIAKGRAQIRARHVDRFKDANLCAQLNARVAVDNLVVDKELVRRTFDKHVGPVDVLAIYLVEKSLVIRACFKFGDPRFDTL